MKYVIRYREGLAEPAAAQAFPALEGRAGRRAGGAATGGRGAEGRPFSTVGTLPQQRGTQPGRRYLFGIIRKAIRGKFKAWAGESHPAAPASPPSSPASLRLTRVARAYPGTAPKPCVIADVDYPQGWLEQHLSAALGVARRTTGETVACESDEDVTHEPGR